ncbi:hypothetical protein [Aquincola sp. J276]|uniref:hypothetical protein n=1 Tax=Aquincola sp. J276 TaxID=2898432 RepID=UPI00215166D6|nr:hypothetical protein [Aquincola sp. J276]MCR5865213.1 hypothetical protein [Aquincola sp. J276]
MKPDEAAKLDLDALTGSNIEYTLKIRYKVETTDKGQKLMNTLGSALRNAEGLNAKVHLVGGGTIAGNQLRLAGRVRITTIDGIPDANEVFETMRTWLLQRVQSDDVQI